MADQPLPAIVIQRGYQVYQVGASVSYLNISTAWDTPGTVTLSGTISTNSTVTGEAYSNPLALEGAASPGASAVTGGVDISPFALGGQIDAVSIAFDNGEPGVLAGQLDTASTISGNLQYTGPMTLIGGLFTDSAVQGTLGLVTPLGATTVSLTGVDAADVSLAQPLAGTVPSLSSLTPGELTINHTGVGLLFGGTIDAVSAVSSPELDGAKIPTAGFLEASVVEVVPYITVQKVVVVEPLDVEKVEIV